MSRDMNLLSKRALEQEQNELLQQVEDWLEIPMLLLSFVWLALFVVELIWGLSPLLDALGNPNAEVAGAKAIVELQAEITALRSELQALLHQKQEK